MSNWSNWNVGYTVRIISNGKQIACGKVVAIVDRAMKIMIGVDYKPTDFKIMCDRSALSTGANVLMARPL